MAVNVAKRFRLVRKTKKMTIKEVSKRSGVPYSTLRRFESTGEISFMGFVKIMSTIDEDREIQGILADWLPGSIDDVIRYNKLREEQERKDRRNNWGDQKRIIGESGLDVK